MAVIATPTSTSAVSQSLMDSMNTKNSTGNEISAEQDKFMTLLITQLKNQDPLNPLDNAQVTSQLAQLNTVTGINKLNDTLETLKTDLAASQSAQAVNMINHGVLAPGKSMQVAEGKGIFGIELGSYADTVQLDIKNSSGKVVHSLTMNNVEAGVLPLAWDGKLEDGKTAPDGTYTLALTATTSGKALTDAQALAFGTVASVSTGPGGAKLNVPGMGQLTMDDIKQVL
ncbi:flagellar hook assembly protein FlgD [Pseudoduganella albidiflava]|uniref:Basal-body rod modification protein FlgD n=1 Tax=Pseudoduganella albidiflava TaxID=321983 RepID=A0A411WTS1_9BURK|nr:flagellar hook assembly protein FlgD [Pseudoduganella albidiflava]QBI00181.1 flagellar hook assembly protein FlgD [Pseudoduganella albidiflava]GGY66458.1 basal-body rod modification protein FlgD [Pseudoduganella albidiflava]